MLDAFLEVMEKNAAAQQQEDELTKLMMQLPLEEVSKIASLGKAAFCGDDDGKWLKKYEGTALYEKAIALEEELLNIEAEDIKRRLERPKEESTWEKKDMVRLKKRVLDLQLSQQSANAGGKEEGEEEGDEDEDDDVVNEPPIDYPMASTEKMASVQQQNSSSDQAFDLAGRAFAHAMNKVDFRRT